MDAGHDMVVEQPRQVGGFSILRYSVFLLIPNKRNLPVGHRYSIETSNGLRPHRPFHPPIRNHLLRTRFTYELILVGYTRRQRSAHDRAWRMGLSVEGASANIVYIWNIIQ